MEHSNILNGNDWRAWVRSHGDDSAAPPLRKHLTAAVKGAGISPTTGLMRFDFTASTGAVDREGDIIEPGGWELDDYRKNAVILWAHDYSTPPIGRAVKVGVRGGALRVRVEFTPEEVNADGFKVHQLVEAGFLRAVSVGFRPLKYAFNNERQGYDFQRAELLEVSVVPVPANQEALIAAGVGGDAAQWLRRQLGDGPEVMTEAEARQIITDAVTDTVAGVVELDMTEAELRLTIHRAVADVVLRTEGRLVDDPEPEAGPEVELLRGAVRQALATVQSESSGEAALRSKIETMLRERLGQ